MARQSQEQLAAGQGLQFGAVAPPGDRRQGQAGKGQPQRGDDQGWRIGLREADEDRGGGHSQDRGKKRKGQDDSKALFGHGFRQVYCLC